MKRCLGVTQTSNTWLAVSVTRVYKSLLPYHPRHGATKSEPLDLIVAANRHVVRDHPSDQTDAVEAAFGRSYRRAAGLLEAHLMDRHTAFYARYVSIEDGSTNDVNNMRVNDGSAFNSEGVLTPSSNHTDRQVNSFAATSLLLDRLPRDSSVILLIEGIGSRPEPRAIWARTLQH